jgi:uracil-DNA glycosylase family 4
MISANDLSPAELAALLHFHADAGVDWLLEDTAIDRFAEFEASRAKQQVRQTDNARSGQTAGRSDAGKPSATTGGRPAAAAPPMPNMAVPDEQAVAAARFAAESARSLEELKTALESFNGCNLKNGARNTVFATGTPGSKVMIIGPMPDADDDRDGLPFSGKAGMLLDRMLAAIDLDRNQIALANTVPWRPPGNRAPSGPEMNICRPFIERQIALFEPKLLLLLGNVTARFFFGGTGTIHTMRGQWREVPVGGVIIPALASLHPQELLNAPASKALAWQDLLSFKSRLAQM